MTERLGAIEIIRGFRYGSTNRALKRWLELVAGFPSVRNSPGCALCKRSFDEIGALASVDFIPLHKNDWVAGWICPSCADQPDRDLAEAFAQHLRLNRPTLRLIAPVNLHEAGGRA